MNQTAYRIAVTTLALGVMALSTGCRTMNENRTGMAQPAPVAAADVTPAVDRLQASPDKAATGSDTTARMEKVEERPDEVQAGDLVSVDYTLLTRDDRALIYTTREDIARYDGMHRADGYIDNRAFAPVQILAGEADSAFGMGEAVLGLSPGKRKGYQISAEEGFGAADPEKILPLPRFKRIERSPNLTAIQFVSKFGRFPEDGETLSFDPYLNATVTGHTRTHVAMALAPKAEGPVAGDFGTTHVRVKGEEIEIELAPTIGAPFAYRDKIGRIIAADATHFKLDFNPPLAGKPMMVDLKVVELTKASKLKKMAIHWVEDHDRGLAAAARENKPVVLVLYAGWCQWSKRLMETSIADPRVRQFHDRFVWIRVNSDQQKEYKEGYGQKGFPMTIIIGPDGEVKKKIDGFKDGGALYMELSAFLNGASNG